MWLLSMHLNLISFKLIKNLKLILNSVIGKLLNMFQTTWVCEYILIVNLIESKPESSISN